MRLCLLIITLATIICSYGCKNIIDGNNRGTPQTTKAVPTKRDSLAREKDQRLLSALYNKEAAVFNTIIPDLKNENRNIILVVSKFDCVTCVEAGFNIIRQIKKINRAAHTYVVGVTKEVYIPEQYKYTVYEDIDQNVQTALNYAPTPVILILNGNRIIDLYSPYDSKSLFATYFINEHSY